MQPALNATVFIVDDDAGVRDALAWLLRSRHLPSEVFASGEDFERDAAGRLCAARALLPAAGRAHARHERAGLV
jgi:FixJ family two-component response regulator